MEQRAMEMKLTAVTEMWKEIDGEKLRMMKETQQIRIELDRERLARQQLELQLREAQQQVGVIAYNRNLKLITYIQHVHMVT
jgi:hypothetical protein